VVLGVVLRLRSGEWWLDVDDADAGGNEDKELWWVVSAGAEILLVFVFA
jgi:hypothetical protein